jgi:GDPmannose 4,6-dehydratase
MEKILITGITGQDGLFLTKNILKTNPDSEIYGISRNTNNLEYKKSLEKLDIEKIDNIEIFNVNLMDKINVKKFINSTKPTTIFNLAGPSSVSESLIYPKDTFSKITTIFNNLTEVLIEENVSIPFFQASSSEMFGSSNTEVLNENSVFRPQSPYAKAKLQNHKNVINLSKHLNIKSGIMFNHESEFRKTEYLFMKVINAAKNISEKKLKKLTIGSLTYERDWSFAGDVSRAMLDIINFGKENSYIIGTGKSHTIEYLISLVFDFYSLNWRKYIEVDSSLLREGDPEKIYCDPSRLKNELNWKPLYSFEELVERCILNSVRI